jgi:hypothetical protein
MLKDSNVKETICKYLNSTQGNQLQRIHTRKNWYRMGSRNSVGEAYTSKYLKFYAKALELNNTIL